MPELFKSNGKKLELESASGWQFSARPGGWWIAERQNENGLLERKRVLLTERRGVLSATIDGETFFGEVQAAQRGGATVSGGEEDLVAQFPGKVRKCVASEGSRVEQGDVLLLIEAMKMEFSIKAPFSGTIKKILVKEGQQLSPGDQLVDLKEDDQ